MPMAEVVKGSLQDALANDEAHMDLAVLGRVAERRAGRH
jgi:hypothetical protein